MSVWRATLQSKDQHYNKLLKRTTSIKISGTRKNTKRLFSDKEEYMYTLSKKVPNSTPQGLHFLTMTNLTTGFTPVEKPWRHLFIRELTSKLKSLQNNQTNKQFSRTRKPTTKLSVW